MRLGFCQPNDQTNLNWSHFWNVATYNNFFQEVIRADSSAGSFSQLGMYNSELCTCIVISVPPRSLRGCHGSSQRKPPSTLCHASPSCPMTICRQEKNHCSQCFKGHIFFPPSVQRHAKRYDEDWGGVKLYICRLLWKITWRYFRDDWSPPLQKHLLWYQLQWTGSNTSNVLRSDTWANNRGGYSSLYSFRLR